MISVEGLARRNKETMEYLDRLESDTPLVFQIFGGKPENYAEAVRVAENECVQGWKHWRFTGL